MFRKFLDYKVPSILDKAKGVCFIVKSAFIFKELFYYTRVAKLSFLKWRKKIGIVRITHWYEDFVCLCKLF